jgi:histidine ammonia-lyase
MAIILTGNDLKIEDLVNVARNREKVELHPEAKVRIKKCRAMLERKLSAHEIMYGVNTGIGEFSEIVLNDEQIKDFQKYLIYNHAAGIGDASPVDHVRAAMLLRANVHAHGNSGCRLEITQCLIDMLNNGISPYVCEKGSVGACGDLAPMSQIALCLMGENKVMYKGEWVQTRIAFEKAGITYPGLMARDGLAAINGSNFLTGMSALMIYDTNNWLKQAEIACAMSLEGLKANLKPYDLRLLEARGFPGGIRSAKAIHKVCQDGDLAENKLKVKVQDAYSMRSTPAVIGAAHDQLKWARSQVEIEMNGVGDNPIFFPDQDVQLSGANFQGSPVAVPMDMVGAVVTMVSVLSERRMNRLNNPALSVGLPPFLTKGAGMFSGLMLSQYTADMQIVEQRILSMPASIQSIPAAADQEDFVSMGMNTALKNFQILDNAYGVLGIEFMAAAQALDLREKFETPYRYGLGTSKAREIIRKHVDYLDIDRPLFTDHNAMKELVKSCEILKEVEKIVGSLD